MGFNRLVAVPGPKKEPRWGSHRIGVHLKDWHIIRGVRAGNSPWSSITVAQVPVKEPAPSAL